MTATTTKPITAHLQLTAEFGFSVRATEAEWKKLTKDYQDPEEDWALQDVIHRFINEALSEQLSHELEGIEVELEDDTVCGLAVAIDPLIHHVQIEDVELAEIG